MADAEAPAEAPAVPAVDPDRELVIRAQAGDSEAIAELWTAAIPVTERIARNGTKRYPWIDPEEVAQELQLDFQKILRRFDVCNLKGNHWKKYYYHRAVFTVKDILRREDPLGIRFPFKKQYPEWYRLGDEAFDGFEVDSDHAEPLDQLIESEIFTTFADLDADIAELQAGLNEISHRPDKAKGFRKKRPKPNPLARPKSKNRKGVKTRVFSKKQIRKNSLQEFLRTKKTANGETSKGANEMQIRNERKQLICDAFQTQTRLTISQAISLTKLKRWQFRTAWDDLLQSGEIIRNGKLKQKNGPLTQLFSLKGAPQMEPAIEQATTPETETNQAPKPKPTKKPVKKKASTKKVAKGKPEPTAFDQLSLAGRFADSCGGISKAIQLLTVLQSMRK
jgi:hypothetical protein